MGASRWFVGWLAVVLLTSGCDRRQRWEISNGSDLGPQQPPQIVAEIYEGGECGPCDPQGSRVYCANLTRGTEGPAPMGLVDGEPYCFVATALDEDGQAVALGCVDAPAGEAPIRISLAPIEVGRFLVPSCQQPGVFVDAGPPFDAGPRMDAGPAPDAGPPPPDAGPPADAGPPPLPDGTMVSVTFTRDGDGTGNLFDHRSGALYGEIPRSPGYGTLTTIVGDVVRVEASPAPGWTLSRIEGGGCGPQSPCVIRVARSETIRVVFNQL